MSKLALENRVPYKYDKATFADIIRAITSQVNSLSEGAVAARYQAQVAVPVSVAAAVSDVVWDSNATVTNGTVRLGWVCNVGSPTAPTFQEIRALTGAYLATLGTEVPATSGTSIDFTGIPSWVKEIIIQFVGVSTNGTGSYSVQLGDAGGIETAGYSDVVSHLQAASVSTGNGGGGEFLVTNGGVAAGLYHGHIRLTLEDEAAFTWVISSQIGRSDAASLHVACGSKSLSAALDRVRLKTNTGDTFDAGAINIIYR